MNKLPFSGDKRRKPFPIILTLAFLILTSCTTKQFPKTEYDQAYETLISENYTQATKQFARLSSKYSVYPEIWYQYGSCCMETGDYDTAIASFNKAAELYENSVMYDANVYTPWIYCRM